MIRWCIRRIIQKSIYMTYKSNAQCSLFLKCVISIQLIPFATGMIHGRDHLRENLLSLTWLNTISYEWFRHLNARWSHWCCASGLAQPFHSHSSIYIELELFQCSLKQAAVTCIRIWLPTAQSNRHCVWSLLPLRKAYDFQMLFVSCYPSISCKFASTWRPP